MTSTLLFLAAAPANAGPPVWTNFVLLGGMALIFWFLILGPQRKRMKEHQAKVAGLKKGDRVVTAGGLIGKVVKLDDDYVDLELAQGVRVKAVRSTIGDVIPAVSATPAND